MTWYGLCLALVALITQTCAVYGQEDIIKSSLTFVIDDTGSMWNEIRQVKDEVNIIFEKVLSSRKSQIENFILVTFNDPLAELRTITKDRNEFKNALAAITVHGGDDCPEYAMKGIELALTKSLPLSYLYVFTDASAKDHAMFEKINSLAQKKQIQVVFILTGQCGSERDADFQVYHKVAKATSGQVFHMMKDDVKDILKYIEETITSRGIPLFDKILPPGYGKKIEYPVDSHTGKVLIAVTGDKPMIGTVTGPDGSRPETKHIFSGKDKMAAVAVTGAKPGVHEVEIGSRSETHAVVTGESDLNFQLGFSVFRPTSMKDTVTRPPPEGKTFLGIKVLGDGVKLTTAKILDLSDNVITELLLELVDDKAKFYTTPSFDSPTTMFRVSVSGKDVKDNSPITRTGPTPIKRQDLATEKIENKAPKVTIEGASTILTEYDDPLHVKCKVHGYPAPDIIWEEKETGIKMPAEVISVDVPYDYVSFLNIEKANKNTTYQCKANNPYGVDVKHIEALTKRNTYFDVIEVPKDISVEYTKEGSIVCKIDAKPPAPIAWYKDGKPFSGNTNVEISSDKSILTIKNMQPDLKGMFTCEAKNKYRRELFHANLDISGVEKPIIDKSHERIRASEKKNAEVSCRIVQGIPKATIRWSFKPTDEIKFRDIEETDETLYLNNVRKDQTGSYQCIAENIMGSDRATMKLIVEYPPIIKDDAKLLKSKDGDELNIPCDVTGEPAPTVKWFFNGTRLYNTTKTLISSDHSLKLTATPADTGYYMCEAENKLGPAQKTVFVDVFEKPFIDKSHEKTRATEKKNAELSCRILKGIPKPTIRWSFKPADEVKFSDIEETDETLNLKNVRKDQTGSYQCIAENIIGEDRVTMELIVEYPPIIKDDAKLLRSKDGDELKIPCDVTGEPVPTVKWFFNGTRLYNTTKTLISSDHSLKLTATLADTGYYMCEAENKLGPAQKTVFVDIFVPVTIERPKDSTIEIMVGKNQILYCRADGYPKPEIKWTFRSSDSKIPDKDVTSAGGFAPITLKKVQLNQQGFYTCVAENEISGSANITYEVNVYAPPVIENVYSDKTFEVVKGDSALRIQCKATGSPKPTITWKKNDVNVPLGSERYEIEDDGTLVINEIDDISQGTYVCLAENKMGKVSEVYEVIVKKAPAERPTRTISVEIGKSLNITCDIPHKNTDKIRWFKDGKSIGSKEINLINVSQSNDGLYTCRVSDSTKTRSATTKVVVGSKPEFTSTEKETVEFVDGTEPEILSCNAIGVPMPKHASWKHNGKEINSTTMLYPLGMILGATGIYVCEVSNEFGTIRRSFNVTSKDCILHIKTDFTEKHPLMYSRSLGWPVFQVTKGYMIIPNSHYFFLNCPSGFSNFPGTNAMAFCEGDSTVKIFGNPYNFADIECKKAVTPEILKTGHECIPGNTELIKIGYKVFHKFLEAYSVCVDKDNNVVLFAEHNLSPDHTDISAESEWFNNYLPQDLDGLYDCKRQAPDIGASLGRGLRTHDSCCFARRQLVNPRNLLPGIPTSASFNYLNVIPHWSTCNSKNWNDVEQRVRRQVILAGRDLIVTTGTSNHPGGLSTDITLHDGRGGSQTVARYLWKVVQDPPSKASLAIIQVNIPELSPTEASKHVLCHDICENIEWMQNPNWSNVEDGFTYCCAIIDFENSFGYNKRFSPGMNYVIMDDLKLLPDFSAKK